jgi:hypothetical protein
MATKAIHGVTGAVGDAVACAFAPSARRSMDPGDMLKELEEVRRATRYHRERFYQESQRRRQVLPSERAVRLAVLEALNKEESR